MADSFVQLPTDSTGKKIDTRTEGSNSEHRQVMVIGDPATNAGVAPVDVTKGLAVDLSATGANSNKLLVTPDLPSGASTAAKQPALGTAGTASTDVISIQGIAAMTKLLVTPDSVALPANQSVNQAQVAGTTTDTNSGNKSAGTQRVVLATDQPTMTNAQPVTLTSTTITGTVTVDDLAAAPTGAAVPANAQYQGNLAQTALPSAATAGNLAGAMADKYGRTVVLPGTIRDLVGTQTTTISASTSETTIVTAAASIFNDLTTLIVSNTSATAVRVDFRDTTGGSILFSLYIPAGDMRGVSPTRPLPQTSVNTNWTAQSSASVTDLRVYCVFDKNK